MTIPAVIATVAALQSTAADWRRDGLRAALVPTMGALHAGHLSLIEEARRRADKVVVSIFVNPRQFAPNEDFDRYPRDIDADREKLARQGLTDIVFAPTGDELYPTGFATRIELAGPAIGLETEFRPHFFSGVATVVAKLLIAATPDFAMFGEKDYQQLLVVRRLARDLGISVEIIGCPILREADGLALSSRNAYLGPPDRAVAAQLNRVLTNLAVRVRNRLPIETAEQTAKAELLATGFDSVDYVAVRNAQTLAPIDSLANNMRALAAATIGGTRLIDNIAV